MEIKKCFPHWILIISLSTTSAFSQAGPASDARDLLDETRESARVSAMSTLTEVFGEIIARAEPLGQMLMPLSSAQNEMVYRLDRVRRSLDGAALDESDAESLIRDDGLFLEELDRILDSYGTRFVDIQNQLRLSLIRFRSTQAGNRMVRDVMEKIRRDMIEVCSRGIAVSVDSRQLPGVQIRAPQFQISFSVNSDGEKTKAQPGNGGEQEGQKPGLYLFPIFDEMGKDGSDYNAAASYVSLVGFYAAFGGFQAASATAMMSAGLAAGGVTLVIAVALLAIQDSISRQKATEAANAMERVFWQRADAQVVAEDMRKACEPTLEILRRIPEDVKLQLAGDRKARQEFAERERASIAFLKKISEVSVARARKIGELKSADLSTEAFARALKESVEDQDYRTFLSQDALARLGEAVGVSLTKVLIESDRHGAEFEAYSRDRIRQGNNLFVQLEKEIPRMRERFWHLNRLRMEVSLENQQRGIMDLLREEGLMRSTDIVLYRRWQKAYALVVGKVFFGQAAPLEAAELSGVLTEVHRELLRRPGSGLLRMIDRRSRSLLNTLRETP